MAKNKKEIKVEQSDLDEELVVDGKFITRSGPKLPLKVVNTKIVRTLSLKMSPADFSQDNVAEVFAQLQPQEAMQVMKAWENLTHYCLGNGVDVEVPEDEDIKNEMKSLGFWDENPMLRKSWYLQMFVLDDEEEIGHLVGSVMAFSQIAENERRASRENQPGRKKKK